MNRTKRDVWRERVWFHLQDNLLFAYCERETFQWLLDVMYYVDTCPADAACMIHKIFVQPQFSRQSGMQLLHEWRIEPDDPLDHMEGSGHEKD